MWPVRRDLFHYFNNIAKYWKNGHEVLLTGPVGAGANSIAVDGSDVYVAGWGYKGNKTIAKYWKNGQSVELSDGTNPAFASGISVVDGNVYVVGSEGSAARYWKNGEVVTLSENGSAFGIAVNGNNVFVAGEEMDAAVGGYASYWTNGNKFSLMQSANRSQARFIALEGGHVYVAGFEEIYNGSSYVDSKGRYWKDGREVLLQGSAAVSSIAVFNGDVYVSGYYPKDASSGRKWDDVYLPRAHFSHQNASGARYWVNGKAVTLPGTMATGVFLVPR